MNSIKMEILAKARNVKAARVVTAAFIAPYDPTVDEVADIKTAVSEAVTNAVIHGYGGADGDEPHMVTLELDADGEENPTITVKITDSGVGIENIETAREPLFTTKPELERSGLGFTVMESFMDTVEIASAVGEGTTITLKRKLGAKHYE